MCATSADATLSPNAALDKWQKIEAVLTFLAVFFARVLINAHPLSPYIEDERLQTLYSIVKFLEATQLHCQSTHLWTSVAVCSAVSGAVPFPLFSRLLIE